MTDIVHNIKELFSAGRKTHAYKLERAILRFTELLSRRMNQLGIGPSRLAEKIDVKPPYVSKILHGKSNFTFDSIIKLCTAVDADFVFDVRPKEKKSQWVSIGTRFARLPISVDASFSQEKPTSTGRYNRVGSTPPMMKLPDYDNTLYT
jgi:plasmid maintenance system antidote protein VapI